MLTYTNHALERMTQKFVTEAEVIEALNSPISIARDGDAGCKVYYGLTKAGRGIRIVLAPPNPNVVLVTVSLAERKTWPEGGKL